MADYSLERIEEQLKVKIGEAKDLLTRNSNTAAVYCTIALDQEEICRTPTIERTLAPFFGEEFEFKIPRKFRHLSIYVWDRDRHLKPDKPIGKVFIKQQELQKYNNKEFWFSLIPVDADSEVQGKARVQITFEDGLGYLKRSEEYDDRRSLETRCIQNDYKENNETTNIRNNHQLHNHNHNHNHNLHHHKLSSKRRNTTPDFRKTDTHGRVTVRLMECLDLAKKNGACNPFAQITATYTNGVKLVQRTKVRKKTNNPKFTEPFSFDLTVNNNNTTTSTNNIDSSTTTTTHSQPNAYSIYPIDGADLNEISLTLWHSTPTFNGSGGGKVFLGEIRIPMLGRQQQAALKSDAWYYFKPRSLQESGPPGTPFSCPSHGLGTLRVKIAYTALHVFPLATYDNLMDLLMEGIEQKPITASAVHILGQIVANKTDVAHPLVRLFTHKKMIATVIKQLAEQELSELNDLTTIFRGNTLVSKMMDEAMRLSGLHYLHNTLRPVIKTIIQENKSCEIDPAKVNNKNLINANFFNLADYVKQVFEAIINSGWNCPPILRQLFHDLRDCAVKRFPYNSEVRYSVVSSFIFLRFFAPAILGPKLFDLANEPLDENTARTLKLISKTIQSIGNFVSSRSSNQFNKEEFTGELYKHFCKETYVESAKKFLDEISTVTDGFNNNNNNNNNSSITPAVLLKEGMMTKKRAQSRKPFGSNFKQRFFQLSTNSLSYAKAKGKRPTCDIPITEIVGVERLSNNNDLKMQNIFQIILRDRDRPLYVQTQNCVEEKEWIDLLEKICENNKERHTMDHLGAFVNGHYTCCGRMDEASEGCSQVVAYNPYQWELATTLDPAKDLERIHQMIWANIETLKRIYHEGGERLHWQQDSSHRSFIYPNLMNEKTKCRKTIFNMISVADNLNEVHTKCNQSLLQKLMPGSKEIPIGDDNYLQLSSMNRGFASKRTVVGI